MTYAHMQFEVINVSVERRRGSLLNMSAHFNDVNIEYFSHESLDQGSILQTSNKLWKRIKNLMNNIDGGTYA